LCSVAPSTFHTAGTPGLRRACGTGIRQLVAQVFAVTTGALLEQPRSGPE